MSQDITPIDKNAAEKALDAKKKFWSEALMQLTASERFIKFVDSNYTIGIAKDDATKTVEVQVVEKPNAVGPALSGEQHFKLGVACHRSGAKEPVTLLNNILKILGQEPKSAIITEADQAELKRAIADADAQDELKKGLDV